MTLKTLPTSIRYNGDHNAKEVSAMSSLSLQAKKAYYAEVRQSNYAASLRLEGFDSTPADAKRKLLTREAALRAIRARQA